MILLSMEDEKYMFSGPDLRFLKPPNKNTNSRYGILKFEPLKSLFFPDLTRILKQLSCDLKGDQIFYLGFSYFCIPLVLKATPLNGVEWHHFEVKQFFFSFNNKVKKCNF